MQTPLDVVDVALDLMRIESTSGSEGAVIAFVDRLLESRGWRTSRVAVTTGRDDLFATATDAPLVTLSTHLDTVPPYIPPARTAERITGRGACDAKGIAAAMICAAERLRDASVPVALLFVVGEETCHDGAHAANDALRRGDLPRTSRALINGEPTESTLALGTKGAVRMTLRTAGRAAHSAYPHLGRSATMGLVRLLSELDSIRLPRDAVLGDTTINIGCCRAAWRTTSSPRPQKRDSWRASSGRWTTSSTPCARGRADRATLEVGISVPPCTSGPCLASRQSVVAFATDIPALTAWGTPYLFGPGSVHVAHTDDEFIEIAELRRAVERLRADRARRGGTGLNRPLRRLPSAEPAARRSALGATPRSPASGNAARSHQSAEHQSTISDRG
jgi:acetylornithine deacetylase